MSRRTTALIAVISSMVLTAGACNPMLSPTTDAASTGSLSANPSANDGGVIAQGTDDPAGDDRGGVAGPGADDPAGDDHGGQGGGVDDPANHQ